MTYRTSADRSRLSILISEDTNARCTEVSKQLGIPKYDVMQAAVWLVDFDDPQTLDRMRQNFDHLPEKLQKNLALKIVQERERGTP